METESDVTENIKSNEPISNKAKKHKRRLLLTKPINGIDEFITALSKRTGYSKGSLRLVVESIRQIFEDAIRDGIRVEITDLLVLYHQKLPARKGVNAYKTRMNKDHSVVWEEFEESQRSVLRLSNKLRDLSKLKFKERLKEDEDYE
jgi:nucleoid DNA-binding protein